MRFVVYTDQVYKRVGKDLWTDRTFPLFVAEVGRSLTGLKILGRIRGDAEAAPFRMPDGIDFVALPHYDSLTTPGAMLRGSLASTRAFWHELSDVEGAWIMGPHPIGLIFALLTLLRGRRLVLGVRQEFSAYARRRHPRRRVIHRAADLLEGVWRSLARISAVVVVGPELGRQYRHARRLQELRVSMMRATDIVTEEVERSRRYDREIVVLSVGRLDEEKNPTMLADVLALLRRDGPWRLIVCGKGPCEGDLRRRLRELDVEDFAELKGYVPVDGGLRELYRGAGAFLHVSWTEGVPQVLFEAFAARLPVVATDVGGVRSAAEGAALLVEPGDPAAAASALKRIASGPGLRARLTDTGAERARDHTFDLEAARVASFLTMPRLNGRGPA